MPKAMGMPRIYRPTLTVGDQNRPSGHLRRHHPLATGQNPQLGFCRKGKEPQHGQKDTARKKDLDSIYD